MGNFKEDLTKVKAFVFDCDGVFTDCSLLLLPPDYQALRTFNARDGYAVTMAVKRGYPLALISGGRGEGVRKRFESLGVKHIELECGDKLSSIKRFAENNGLTLDDIMFMGDDMPDVRPLSAVGMPVCPNDAVAEVKAVSRYVSGVCGGKGCVRDVIEQVLKAQGRWTDDDDTDVRSR